MDLLSKYKVPLCSWLTWAGNTEIVGVMPIFGNATVQTFGFFLKKIGRFNICCNS